MTLSIEELGNEIRSLSGDERMHLLRDLIADLDGAMDADVEKAWLQEAERRHKELREGLVQAIPGDEVFAQARARLRK